MKLSLTYWYTMSGSLLRRNVQTTIPYPNNSTAEVGTVTGTYVRPAL